MKSEDESIRVLEMRMQQQQSLSREKNITPQNIQYYVSSAMLQREKPQPDISPIKESIPGQTIPEKLSDDRKPAGQEKGHLPQKDAESLQEVNFQEKKHEDHWQKFQNYRTKEAVQRMEISNAAELQHIRGKSEYEKVLRSMSTEALSEIELSLFDGKI